MRTGEGYTYHLHTSSTAERGDDLITGPLHRWRVRAQSTKQAAPDSDESVGK